MNRKTEELVFSIIGTLMLIVVLVLLVIMCFRMSHATCTLSWFHPYEWDIYQKCMNDKNVKDIGKKDFFFLMHEYSTSDGEYKIVLDTSSPCMDCWNCYIVPIPWQILLSFSFSAAIPAPHSFQSLTRGSNRILVSTPKHPRRFHCLILQFPKQRSFRFDHL